jgi:hypothetical protein
MRDWLLYNGGLLLHASFGSPASLHPPSSISIKSHMPRSSLESLQLTLPCHHGHTLRPYRVLRNRYKAHKHRTVFFGIATKLTSTVRNGFFACFSIASLPLYVKPLKGQGPDHVHSPPSFLFDFWVADCSMGNLHEGEHEHTFSGRVRERCGGGNETHPSFKTAAFLSGVMAKGAGGAWACRCDGDEDGYRDDVGVGFGDCVGEHRSIKEDSESEITMTSMTIATENRRRRCPKRKNNVKTHQEVAYYIGTPRMADQPIIASPNLTA